MRLRDKVIQGLQHHVGTGCCGGCPYDGECPYDEKAGEQLLKDAIEVLEGKEDKDG